jgi:predicted TIM-barrel fold metal-dependent hydrolase
MIAGTDTIADGLTRARSEQLWDGPVIDCDVHAHIASLEVILPYIDPAWREYMGERCVEMPGSWKSVYPPNAPSSVRPEFRLDTDEAPASSHALVQAQALEPGNLQYALLSCYAGLDSLRHPDLAAVMASAINDWLIDQWLSRDDRLRASLVVPIHTTADAIKEIERVGDHPGFVQVLMPVRAPQPYGRRNWYPLFEAITAHDLVFGLHWGGTSDGAPTPCGWPSWFVEECAGEQQVYMAQLTSMLVEGLFVRFPTLRVALLEGGFAWAPSLLWRIDKDWKGLRRTVPWMHELPSETVRRHVRFATAPVNAGPAAMFADLIEWLSPALLMYSSDYPHHHNDDVCELLRMIPETDRPGVMAENARDWYRL